MTGILTPADLEQLTHKRQPAAQVRELRRMGLLPIVRADGSPAITWEAVNARMVGATAGDDWEMDLRLIQKAG